MTIPEIEEMLAKITPGEWRAGNWNGPSVLSSNNTPICHMRWSDGLETAIEERIAANCQLIAAAPQIIRELLAQLREYKIKLSSGMCSAHSPPEPLTCDTCNVVTWLTNAGEQRINQIADLQAQLSRTQKAGEALANLVFYKAGHSGRNALQNWNALQKTKGEQK